MKKLNDFQINPIVIIGFLSAIILNVWGFILGYTVNGFILCWEFFNLLKLSKLFTNIC